MSRQLARQLQALNCEQMLGEISADDTRLHFIIGPLASPACKERPRYLFCTLCDPPVHPPRSRLNNTAAELCCPGEDCTGHRTKPLQICFQQNAKSSNKMVKLCSVSLFIGSCFKASFFTPVPADNLLK